MDYNELPIGFSFSLAQNPDAMQNFAKLSKDEQDGIVQKARSVTSKKEMRALVNSLSTMG